MKSIFFSLIFFLFLVKPVLAIYNPLEVPNNKYGIHILDENDFENAASLVNSSGGDWGYVTLVIREDDRNIIKWNNAFEKLKRYHLIPLIRLATKPAGDYWEKPKPTDIYEWKDFLSKLNWFLKNRYLIIFNEPNHAKEWGMEVNPKEYAQILQLFSQELKKMSDDYFILNAAFDASAPNSLTTMDEALFIKQMLISNPDIFSFIDGWASHSYPNPGFIGNVNSQGRGTLKTFLWEKSLLNKLNIDKELPVFITETGWPHLEGLTNNPNFYTSDQVADLIYIAANDIWNEVNIVAVTPFILNYQSFPFSNFSWQKISEDKFYPQYDIYRSIVKIAGSPIQVNFSKTDQENNNLSENFTQEKSLKKKIISFLNKYLNIN